MSHVFYESRDLPAARLLEKHYRTIRDEYRRLHTREFVPWPERFLYGEGWTIFGLFTAGRPIEYAARLCPKTADLLGRIDSITQGGFSRLAPDTHIQEHRGKPKSELRCHLGIEIPPGEVGIRVGDEMRTWREGECLVFDDTFEHEAWNRTQNDRIVLLVDFPKGHRIK